VERSKIARISQRIEQVAEVLGRKPLALVFVDTIRGETNEQAVARYVAHRPEHARSPAKQAPPGGRRGLKRPDRIYGGIGGVTLSALI
jgi:hypothetical protein